MCSIGDDVFDDNPKKIMLKEEIRPSNMTCNKCRIEKPCVVLRNKDAYCESCFLSGATHKFKALLGKSRLIRPNDKVLVCYEVGHPSTALLHFLRTGLDLNTPKKLRFDPVFIFIDDQLQLSPIERQSLIEKVKEQVTEFDFKLYLISFASYVSNPTNIKGIIFDQSFEVNMEDKETIQNILYKNCNKTSKNDMKKIFKRQLLIDVAKHLGCKFIFTPEISIDVAYQLLTDVSLGRGPVDSCFSDDRDEDVKILRPLRLFDIKELAFYNRYNKLSSLYVRQKNTNPYSSIQELMKKFVSDLQVNFPATVSTILKTGDKLSSEKLSNISCKLCKAQLPGESSHLTSEESTRFSHLVSTEIVDHNLSQQERYAKLFDKFQNDQRSQRIYCYACSKLVENR